MDGDDADDGGDEDVDGMEARRGIIGVVSMGDAMGERSSCGGRMLLAGWTGRLCGRLFDGEAQYG